MDGRIRKAALAGGLVLAFAGASAQSVNGIYTCVDAKGKRWTSDRYIPECSEREQKLMNSSGTVRAIVPPTLTAKEREAQEQLDKKAAEEAQRRGEERRVQRALLSRYPNKASHDIDRAKAVRSVEESAQAARHNIEELRKQRADLATESEFYRKDPSKMPSKLKRQIEENENSVAAQQRFVANQDEEKKRVNARFDEELAQLKKLWAPALAEAEAPKR